MDAALARPDAVFEVAEELGFAGVELSLTRAQLRPERAWP